MFRSRPLCSKFAPIAPGLLTQPPLGPSAPAKGGGGLGESAASTFVGRCDRVWAKKRAAAASAARCSRCARRYGGARHRHRELPAVLAGSEACDTLEEPPKRSGLLVAHAPTYLVNRGICAFQETARFFDSQALYILEWRIAGRITKSPVERRARHTAALKEVVNRAHADGLIPQPRLERRNGSITVVECGGERHNGDCRRSLHW